MLLQPGNSYTQVLEASYDERKLMEQYCTMNVPKFVYDFENKRMIVESYVKLLYFEENKFPAGWTQKISDLTASKGFEVYFDLSPKIIHSNAVKTHENSIFHQQIKLRNHQDEGFIVSRKQERGIFSHPTRSGKTILIAAICFDKNIPAVIIVNKDVVFNQIINTLKKFSDRVGIIGDKKWKPDFFTVAMVQTLARRLDTQECIDFLHSREMLMLDEAHHVSFATDEETEKKMNTYFEVSMAAKNAQYRYGFTASPWNKENDIEHQLLEGATGQIIHEISTKRLMDDGVLTRGKVITHRIKYSYSPTHPNTAKKHLFSNKYRNNVIKEIAYSCLKANKNVLISCKEIVKQGNVLKKLIPEAQELYGTTKKKDRQPIINDFVNKKKPILISNILNEGADIPNMDCVINCSGFANLKPIRQTSGRVLTKSEDKTEAFIFDFIDDDRSNFNFTNEDWKKGKEPMLFKWSTKRLNEYRSLGFEIDQCKPLKNEVQYCHA